MHRDHKVFLFSRYLGRHGRFLSALICLVLLYSLFTGVRSFAVPDEARYVEIPREMAVSGDYLTPRLNGLLYFEKPPLFYWMQAGAIHLLGVKEWSMRVIPVLFGILGGLLTFYTARRLFNDKTAWLAMLILMSSPLYYGIAHLIILDMMFSFFLTGSLCFFLLAVHAEHPSIKRRWLYGMYAFAALATLTKGLLGFVFPALIIGAWLVLFRQWRCYQWLCLGRGSLIYACIVLPWHILMHLKHADFFHFYIIQQHFLRYATDYASREEPIWFIPAVFCVGLLPWIVILPKTIELAWQCGRVFLTKQSKVVNSLFIAHHAYLIFLIVWTGLMFMFFWMSRSQLASYVLPIYPAVAMLIAYSLSFMRLSRLIVFLMVGLLIGLAALCAITSEIFPVLNQEMAHRAMLGAACMLGMGGLFLAWKAYRERVYVAWIGLSFILMLAWSFANVAYEQFRFSSVKSLALTVKPYLQPNDTVINYHRYYQDMPVYLDRLVVLVGVSGELSFGLKHVASSKLVWSEDMLWQRWHDNQRLFMVMDQESYERLSREAMRPLWIMGRTQRHVLVSNQRVLP